jgi:hypothetical protein
MSLIQDSTIGEKTIWYNGTVLVEQTDAVEFKQGDMVTFINWGNLRIVDVVRDKTSGKVTRITADLQLDNKVSSKARGCFFTWYFRPCILVTWILCLGNGCICLCVLVTTGQILRVLN